MLKKTPIKLTEVKTMSEMENAPDGINNRLIPD